MKPGFTLEAAKTSNTATLSTHDGYRLKFSKTFISATRQWHVEFNKDLNGLTNRYEFFLTDEELKHFKDSI